MNSEAGWYPDPYGRSQWRWFDGAQWTQHVSGPGGVNVASRGGATPPLRTQGAEGFSNPYANAGGAQGPTQQNLPPQVATGYAQGPYSYQQQTYPAQTYPTQNYPQQTYPNGAGQTSSGGGAKTVALVMLAFVVLVTTMGVALVGLSVWGTSVQDGSGPLINTPTSTRPGATSPTTTVKRKSSDTTVVTGDVDVPAIVASVDSFWAQHASEINGSSWSPMDPAKIFTTATSSGKCGSETVPPEASKDNAYYCPPGDFVVYDPGLFPKLQKAAGKAAPALVLAHEWGHRVQTLTGETTELPLLVELQADCYAGVYMSQDHPELDLGDRKLGDSLAATVLFGDSSTLQLDDPSAHGTSFDRLGAFEVGYEQGVQGCVNFVKDPPALVQGFTQGGGGGQLEFQKTIPATIELLDLKETNKLGVARIKPGACQDGRTPQTVLACSPEEGLVYDPVELRYIYDNIGDFAVSAEIVHAYADWKAQTSGTSIDDAGKDCQVGAFAHVLQDGKSYSATVGGPVVLAGDDLDEIVAQVVASTDQNLVFDHLKALRKGFTSGQC